MKVLEGLHSRVEGMKLFFSRSKYSIVLIVSPSAN
jgi:hypothetical protein